MRKLLVITALILLSYTYSAAQWTVQTVPDPKNNGGGYVSDPDNFLKAETIDSLNALIKAADDSNFVQIAVVVLNSIGDEVPKTFATELFNYWKLGKEEINNGLLVLLVMDQRRVEFETGYGIEDVLTDAECYTIQQSFMVPHFKENNYDAGIINGVTAAIYETYDNTYLDNYAQIADNNSYNTNDEYDYYNPSFGERISRFLNNPIGGMYAVILGLFFLVYFILLIVSLFLKDRYHRYQLIRFYTNPIIVVLFLIPFGPLYFLNKFLIEYWRNTPRISKSGQKMHRLSEEEDDKYLKKGQITEEKIRSIDYDVWITDDHQETLILAYKRWFSGYSQCPKCKFKTYYLVYNKTITAATYTSSGTGEKKYSCKNCGHTVVTRYTIPKKQQSSSSSGSYSSWGGGGSSFGGGSSWGGGSSGGGGAGSSW